MTTHTIDAVGVREAYVQGIDLLRRLGVRQPSRGGEVLALAAPVVTVTRRPRQRVLLDWARDANPFFHAAEALWMIAGRQDTAFLDRFVRDFGLRYGEEDGTEHDAYGYRWRGHFGFDQLDAVVERLKTDPLDRQCVIQMWDAVQEPVVGEPGHLGADDLLGAWRTRPCNTHCYVRVRQQYVGSLTQRTNGVVESHEPGETRLVLDLTVLCRSNDAVWGAHGANAVHFSVLQEYLAARVGCDVGVMYQWSNNYHAYVDVLDRLAKKDDGLCRVVRPYASRDTRPLVDDASCFDAEVREVFEEVETFRPRRAPLRNAFLAHTFWPMMCAHTAHRSGYASRAEGWAELIEAPDWRQACVEWLARRGRRS